MSSTNITFADNAIIAKDPASYETVTISIGKALDSFRMSIFSFEVLNSDGSLKSLEDLNEKQAAKHLAVLSQIEAGTALPTPVAGIGINDNFELGSGRDVFIVLAGLGHRKMPVHIRKNQRKDLEPFIAN